MKRVVFLVAVLLAGCGMKEAQVRQIAREEADKAVKAALADPARNPPPAPPGQPAPPAPPAPPGQTGGTSSAELACKSNLKNLGTAMEMFSTDNKGRYPDKLAQLVPKYLKAIPSCPTGSTYFVSSTGAKGGPGGDQYTLVCTGKHSGPSGYPQFTSMKGLVENP